MRLILVCFIFLLTSNYSFSQKKEKRVFRYSTNELLEYRSMDENQSRYPSITIPHEELVTNIKPSVEYPTFLKQKFLSQKVMVKTTFDKEGKIIKAIVEKPKLLLLDSASVNIIRATANYWQPALLNNVPEEITVTIPVEYHPYFDTVQNVCRFGISLFLSSLNIFVDSTTTYPACLFPKAIDSIDFKTGGLEQLDTRVSIISRTEMEKQLPSYSSFSGCFGTVRLGFNVDTNGLVSNIQLVHPVCESLNKEALEDFKNIKGVWKPARRDGQAIESYTEFDIHYDEFGKYDFIHKRKEKLAYAAKMDAYEFMQNKKFDKAISNLKKACNYYLDDMELQYHLALLYIQTDNAAEACKLVSTIKSTAIDKGYPASVAEADIEKLSSELCGE